MSSTDWQALGQSGTEAIIWDGVEAIGLLIGGLERWKNSEKVQKT